MEKIIAIKKRMTQILKGENVIPVTVLEFMTEAKESPFMQNLKEGDKVRVTSISKGRGFQGVVKRHGFHGGPKSHGQKDRLRSPGSIGATAPQRVIKGRKMGGHMGVQKVTVRNLFITRLVPDESMFMVKGAVPGRRGAKVEVRK